MNKLSLNFKYTALQILYWAEASIVFVYVGFYLQAAGMSNGSVGVTIAFANILSFALSNAFAELIDRKNKLTSFTASVFLLGLKILLSCSLAVLKDRNALPVAILYMFLIVFNLMSSIVYNKLYVDIEKSGNTVNFSRARGMGSLSFAVASAILGALTLTSLREISAIPFPMKLMVLRTGLRDWRLFSGTIPVCACSLSG